MQKTNSAKFIYLFFFTCFLGVSSAFQKEKPTLIDWDNLEASSRIKEQILQNDYLRVQSKLTDIDKKAKRQKLDYQITGLHPASCQKALPKLALYENYSNYLGFIKKSSYFEQGQVIDLVLGHALLPFNMGLRFKLERIKKPGVYLFVFTEGFLKGLEGQIHVSEHKERCLFHSKAKWRGPDTGISPRVFSFFSTTLSRMAMKGLFRASTPL